VVAVVGLMVAAVLGAGTWAATSLIGGGAQPSQALPATSFAYVAVDLDPSAGQKIEAFRTLRAFPGLRDRLGLDDGDDLRRSLFDAFAEDTGCRLSFDRDVDPWLGERAAFAGVLIDGEPVPAVAVQVDDGSAAREGAQRLLDCAEDGAGADEVGYALGDDYLVISDSGAHASQVVGAARAEPLAEAPGFRRWTEETGDAGVVSFYIAPEAATVARDAMGDAVAGTKDLDAFEGLAGTVRFGGGGLELAVAGGGIPGASGGAHVGEEVGRLPADTALAAGVGLPTDFAQRFADRLGAMGDAEDLIAEAETVTGLDLPEDLQALFGQAVVVSVGGDAPAALSALRGPEDVPAAVTVTGDPDDVADVLAKIRERSGLGPSDLGLVERRAEDRITFATRADYARQVLDGTGPTLADDATFAQVVPAADRATGVLFLRPGDRWRSVLFGSAGEAADNVGAVRAVGGSAWSEGEVWHGLLRLTTR